jgi:hypothetical protein
METNQDVGRRRFIENGWNGRGTARRSDGILYRESNVLGPSIHSRLAETSADSSADSHECVFQRLSPKSDLTAGSASIADLSVDT